MEKKAKKETLVLLVEDDFIQAIDAEDSITSAGGEVIKTADVDSALSALKVEQIDCAIVDYNLSDEVSIAVINKLIEIEIPYAVVSGEDISVLLNKLPEVDKIYRKPTDYIRVLRLLREEIR